MFEPDPHIAPYIKPHLIPKAQRMNAFTGQLQGEEAYFYVRRHWIVEMLLVLRMVFWISLPITIYALIQTYAPNLLDDGRDTVGKLLIALDLLYLGLIYFVHWIDNMLDVVVVTDRRLVDINQNRLFHRETTEVPLSQIQDASANIRGILGTLLRYGNLVVQTAGERQNVEHRTIAHPTTLASQILKVRDDFIVRRSREGAYSEDLTPGD